MKGVRGFYARRARRIMPEIVAAWLLVTACFAYAGGTIGIQSDLIELPAENGALGLLLHLRELLPLWCVVYAAPAWNPPFWSLGAEVLYYALAPLLLMLTPRKIWVIAGASFVLNIAVRCGAVPVSEWHLWPAWLSWLWLIGYLHAITPGVATRLCIALSPVAWQVLNVHWHGGNAAALTIVAIAILCQHEITIPAQFAATTKRLGAFSYSLYALHVPMWIVFYLSVSHDWRVSVPLSLLAVYAVHLAIEGRKNYASTSRAITTMPAER